MQYDDLIWNSMLLYVNDHEKTVFSRKQYDGMSMLLLEGCEDSHDKVSGIPLIFVWRHQSVNTRFQRTQISRILRC